MGDTRQVGIWPGAAERAISESAMLDPSRRSLAVLLPPLAGLAWLWWGAHLGAVGFTIAAVPGGLLVATGVATLLYPGDVRIPQFMALGAALGLGAGALLAFWLGVGPTVFLAALSALSFLAAGRIGRKQETPTEDVPSAPDSILLDGEVGFDEVVLASLTLKMPSVPAGEHARAIEEMSEARGLYAERGWLDDPSAFHRPPEAPARVELPRATVGTLSYEHLQFESEYEPWPEEPGRDRWLSRVANRRVHAWVLRHGATRPWLVCIHGYEMGVPRMDFDAFRARRLHDELGLNLAFPTLPLHGPRRRVRHNGGGYLGADFLDTIHAQAQATWDIRRILAWIRAQTDAPIGAYGLSLGGYNAALLAALEPLATVIAGVPAVDFLRLTRRLGSPLQVRTAESVGLEREHSDELFRVISPLALDCQVERERRAIFAGIADRVVPPDHPRDLWRHWEKPRIVWYPGGHVSFRRHATVDRLIDDALRVGQLLPTLGPI